MAKQNFFTFILSNSTTRKGDFNIYQGKSGAIYLQMGNCVTVLSIDQIGDLHIPCYDLIDFDHDSFKHYYGQK